MTDNQNFLDSIARFLHFTTEPFDNWEWDGSELLIILNNRVIERYTFADLKEIFMNY